SIPLKGVSSISDIEVTDGEGNTPLLYSSSRLDKNDPASFGRYTTFIEQGSQNIEWYYNLADTSHAWILSYKLHGAIAFYNDHDEFYWNLFTDYTVPVKDVSGELVLPKKVPDMRNLTSAIYVDAPGERLESGGFSADQKFNFYGSGFPPKGMFTIAVGWPKGVVAYSGYVKDSMQSLWGFGLGGIAILLALLWVFYIQYLVPKRGGRGTIIAEYAPPEDLPPAEAELLIKEKLTGKAWPATVVDLAIRGYLTIEEQLSFSFGKTAGMVLYTVIFGALSLLTFDAVRDSFAEYYVLLVWPLLFFGFLWKATMNWRGLFSSKEYILHLKEFQSRPGDELEEYEQEFLKILFMNGDIFSTKHLKSSRAKAQAFGIKMLALSAKLYKETEDDTAAYANSLSRWHTWAGGATAIFFVLGYILLTFFDFSDSNIIFNRQIAVFMLLILIASVIALLSWFNPRLNKKGQLLKEDWLGFKLYLETAERYRMQNLTPLLFEKYLPYAMIFGIEKKWARAFTAVNMNPPSWYASSTPQGGGFVSGGAGASAPFSPSAFA
ncbi:MAG: DUF2207 domain-containing protein, partial [Patescibacteria group bacterium]